MKTMKIKKNHFWNPKPTRKLTWNPKSTRKLTPLKYPKYPLRYNSYSPIQPYKSPSQLFSPLLEFQNSLRKRNQDMIFIDYAPTSKGKCYQCRKRIVKGSPRGFYNDRMKLKKVPKGWKTGNSMAVKRLLCYDCVIIRLVNTRNQSKNITRDYTIKIKKLKRMAHMKKAGRALDTQKLMTAMEEPLAK